MSYWYPRAAVKLQILPEDFQLTSNASLETTSSIIVQARNITIHRADYQTSDTFEMDIDYKNFPFDPRTIRACGVVIYLQDMGSNYKSDGTVNKITPGALTTVDPTISNVVFLGFVDEEAIEFNDTKRTVHFTGRDFTALLIDQKYYDKVTGRVSPIFATQSLDQAIKGLLSAFAATQEIKLDTSRVSGALPVISSYSPDFGAPLAGGRNTGSRESYWDIIQKLCGHAGLICYMGLNTTVTDSDIITKPALILTTPRNQATTEDIKFIYGSNVKNLHFKRKLGRLKGFNIKVVSRIGKQVVTATIPREATAAWSALYGIPRADVVVPVLKPDGSLDTKQNGTPAQAFVFPFPQVANKDALIQIGQKVYEQYSLQQLEGSFDTFEMLGRGQSKLLVGTGEDKTSFTTFDLTQIQKGQTISLEIDTDDLDQISRLTDTATRIQYLVNRNYDPTIASIFATTMGKFSPRFKIKSYDMSIDQDNGWKLHVEFYNIVDTTERGLS